MKYCPIYFGADPREGCELTVAIHSARKHTRSFCSIHSIVLRDLIDRGVYTRKTYRNAAGVLMDEISGAPMSTEFAISRFFTYWLAKNNRDYASAKWALFMDSDVLIRRSINDLLSEFDYTKAVMCVKHDHVPHATSKMDNQPQTVYSRKNWSSVMAFNLSHPSNELLTPEGILNTWPGRDLHAFKWLQDHEIGRLDPIWNYLVDHTELPTGVEPAIVHYTEGSPRLLDSDDLPYSDEFWNTWSEAIEVAR